MREIALLCTWFLSLIFGVGGLCWFYYGLLQSNPDNMIIGLLMMIVGGLYAIRIKMS